ncbi:TPA: hypothetical protein ACGOX2_000832 [Streptococcus suis]
MISDRPTMHISIHYRGNSKYKKSLKQQLSAYSKRVLSEPWEPFVEIHLDSIDIHGEKQIQQELIYDRVVTYHMKKAIASIEELYTIAILLIGLARQRLYENSPDSKTENLMIISITQSNNDDPANDIFDIQWSIGQ